MYAYRYFRSGQMPQLVLGIDNYSSFLGETVEVQQPNGPSEFRRRSTSVTAVGLGLRQQVPWTGGTFSFRSDLTRNDQFSPESKKSFLATPFSIWYYQPSIMYNAYRGAQNISPVLYE